jgi:hypothetical protein
MSRINKINLRYYIYLLGIFLTHLGLSFFFAQDFLTDDINYYYYFGYEQNDFGWIGPAFILGYENDFIRALGEAYRLPGYVIFQSIFMKFFESPVTAIKIAQIIFSSSLVLIAFFISNSISKSNFVNLIVSLFVALWFPIHFYALDLTGVTFSIFLYSLFVWSLFALFSNINKKNMFLMLVGFLLGLMVLAKSNNILIFFSLFCSLWYFNKNIIITLKDSFKSGLALLVVVLPWSYFISNHNNTLIFTSVLGPQALVSYSGIRMQPPDSLMGKIINRYDLYSDEKYQKFRSVYKTKPNPCKDKVIGHLLSKGNPYLDFNFSVSDPECYDWNDYSLVLKKSSKDVLELYSKHLNENIVGFTAYGFSKIAQGFGVSLRGFSDYISLLFFITSLSSSVYLWRKYLYRGFVLFYWASLASFSINAFILMGYVRYRVIFFDLSATILIGLMISSLILKKLHNN